ncbi:MAG: GyrI-like domain-containing protein [Fidelibacterota bacterium]|nr:MAG: GyrI-like domain-containing protein [Candidatus Neomarinimicrobiota bacterium]
MAITCELKEQTPQPALSKRFRAPVEKLPEVLGETFQAIIQFMTKSGERPTGPAFAGYYNMDMADLDVEAGFIIARELPGEGEIQSSQIPGGKMATCLHTGPYSEMEPTYDALFKWIKDNGHEVTGVTYEMYLNGPPDTPMEELQTQILMPLK